MWAFGVGAHESCAVLGDSNTRRKTRAGARTDIWGVGGGGPNTLHRVFFFIKADKEIRD